MKMKMVEEREGNLGNKRWGKERRMKPENDGENESESRNKVADGGSKRGRTVFDSRVSHYLRTRTAAPQPIFKIKQQNLSILSNRHI